MIPDLLGIGFGPVPGITRRTLLGSALLAAPALAAGDRPSTLRFVPEADLTILDPIWTTAIVTMTHSYLVFDMLFGINERFEVQPQMAESAGTEQDGKLWRIRLREGLLFHDGEPVLARDCVASIRRWWARDPFGQSLQAVTDELSAPDDRTIVFRLKRPFPLLPAALGKPIANLCIIMPERLARTDPAQQVTEVVGSGPYRFLPNERVAGSRVAYERFAGYRPRASGTPELTSGPKRAYFDRVEWTIMPDPATAAAALRAGEVDWLEAPAHDLVPMLRTRRDLKVDIKDPLGRIALLRMNQLYPPFDNAAVRRALLGAMDQGDFMAAVAGTDPALSRTGVGFFTPGSPAASDAGLDIWAKRPDVAASRRALAEAGYSGQPVVVMGPADRPTLSALADVAVDLMQRLGMTVDYQVVDWGTLVARRAKKDLPSQGGWNMFPGDWLGLDASTPASYPPLRGNGDRAWFGWPKSPRLEELRQRWLDAADAPAQHAITTEMQRVAFEDVPFVPVGQYLSPTAYSASLTGMLSGPVLFWNIRRT